jgi:ankyrin repeat protein
MKITKTGEKHINEYKNICEAVYACDNDAIREMVKKGVDLNKYYKYKVKNQFADAESYPVHVLFYYGSCKNVYEIFKLFLDNGLDMNRDDLLNKIIYSCYLKGDRKRMIELLIEKNININQKDYNGTNAIKSLCQRNCDCNEDIELAKYSLEHGADPTMKDMYGNNAIKTAKENDCKELLNLLKSYKK